MCLYSAVKIVQDTGEVIV
jgi:hypothetical protein